MKIVTLNGSPKGNELSITMHFMYYIEKLYSEIEFEHLNIGQMLTKMSIREQTLQNILEEISSADGIVWSFPVYTTLIPAQLKRFIEILFERECEEIFQDKYAIALSSSMKFYDHTAHNYMHAVSEDLGMKYAGFYSAQMFDLLKFEERENWYYFMASFIKTFKEKRPVSRRFPPLEESNFIYRTNGIPEHDKIDNLGKEIIILTDYSDPESNIARMVHRFKSCFSNGVKIYNLHDVDIKGGCLGCCKCGLDNQCVYKDGFAEFFQKLKNTDVLVVAGAIKDRFLSSKWKTYFDRAFHNGHTPAAEGTQMCFLISGPLSQNQNLRQWISAYPELGFGNLVDVVSDEYEDSEQIDQLIFNMAQKAIEFSEADYISPSTFLKVGGYKIFRDMIYGLPGAIFRMDYKFFKNRDMFDFPTRNIKARLARSFMGLLLKFKKVRKGFKKQMRTGMMRPFTKFLEKLNVTKEKKAIMKKDG